MILFDIIVFILVLSVLVFVHELGHFLAAKACGIYVDRFSVGMPPRVFGLRLGETDYCIGALPIGGYVKMAGQEDAPRSEEEREADYGNVPPERWYSNKPVWQRIIVIAAGPLMNLALGILIYGIVLGFGATVPETKVTNRIGLVEEDGPAASAPLYALGDDGAPIDRSEPDAVGWQTGDYIARIEDREVSSIMDVRYDAALGKGRTLDVIIERVAPDGTTTRYLSPIQPQPLDQGTNLVRFGIYPFNAALIEEVQPGTPAEEAGLQSGDIIRQANGQWVDRAAFSLLVQELTAGETLELVVERDGETLERTLKPAVVGRFTGILFDPPLGTVTERQQDTRPVVAAVAEEGEDTGLRRKDVIVEIEGQPATAALLERLEEERVEGSIEVAVVRPAIWGGLLRGRSEFTTALPIEPAGRVGVVFGIKEVFHRLPAGEVVPEAFWQGYLALERTLRTLKMLLTDVGMTKELGGPVMIFQATTGAAKMGYAWLMEITALISVNLCVFNLLPLPVLDGGQLVLLAIEGVRKKPIDMRIQERVQQFGVLLIIALMLFVTYNDLGRILRNLVPGG
jgi:regulator of sigma E protease